MPFLVLLLVALGSGLAVLLAVLRYPEPKGDPATAVSETAAGEIAEQARQHPGLRRLLHGRLDPQAATGLALTIALAVAILGGIVVGVLAFLMRSSGSLRGIDRSVGQWGADHATHWSTHGLQYVTDLASTTTAIAVVVVVGIVELARTRNRWVLPFLVSVLLGEVLLVNTIKHVLDRVRPTFNPIAAHLGPSFPSGHSAAAAAVYAAAALVLARHRSRRTRAILFGLAAAIAVGVACSRVMLGVHWLSDVVAGLAFGWMWFALCAIAFGGRFLEFGAPLEQAARETKAPRTRERGRASQPSQTS